MDVILILIIAACAPRTMIANYDDGCRIPLELLRTIIEYIQPQASLPPVALASSALRAEAQRILFAEPKLSTPLSHLQFLDAIISSPSRLAHLVKTYVQFDPLYNAAPTPQLRQTLRERTAAALRVMVNLQRLGYRGSESRSDEPATEILRGCTFKLRALAWVCNGDDGHVLLRQILPHQEALQHLSLLSPGSFSSDDLQAAKLLCPNLVSFTGPISVFPSFLAGKKIRHLEWTVDPAPDLADVDLASLPPELQEVESLVYYAQPDFHLSSITHHLRSVRSLMMPAYEGVRNLAPFRGVVSSTYRPIFCLFQSYSFRKCPPFLRYRICMLCSSAIACNLVCCQNYLVWNSWPPYFETAKL